MQMYNLWVLNTSECENLAQTNVTYPFGSIWYDEIAHTHTWTHKKFDFNACYIIVNEMLFSYKLQSYFLTQTTYLIALRLMEKSKKMHSWLVVNLINFLKWLNSFLKIFKTNNN